MQQRNRNIHFASASNGGGRSSCARLPRVTLGCMFAALMAACGGGGYSEAEAVAEAPPQASSYDAVQTSAAPSSVSSAPVVGSLSTQTVAPMTKPVPAHTPAAVPAPTQSTPTQATPMAAADASWLDVAVKDMRAPDGSYARNDDKILHRNAASYSSQSERASLTMGRYGTKEAFTYTNPDYGKELSDAYPSLGSSIRDIPAWTRLLIWDHVYLGERYGANHAPGYRGNSRVRTWGYEMWVKSKSGTWRQLVNTDRKSAEAWRPTFRGSPEFGAGKLDVRVESDGSTSTRPMPAVGLDSSGTYWFPHGYAGGVQTVDPHDVADVLVLCYSQVVMDDPNGVDDREHARFLFALGADWYPPPGVNVGVYPGVGTSRHKFVTTRPQLHVMHTMSEEALRANPPPRLASGL